LDVSSVTENGEHVRVLCAEAFTIIVAELITSEQNPLLKEIRRAASQGTLTKEGYALAEGFHLLEEALASGLKMGAVIAAEGVAGAVEAMLSRTSLRMVTVPEKLFAGLSSTETPKGVLALVRLKESVLEDFQGSAPLIVILDGVQDPGNAGAVVRSAEAFGATGVVFLKDSVHAYNPKCLRGSAGSIFRVPVVHRADAGSVVEFLKVAGIALFAAMPRASTTVDQVELKGPCALAIGSEAHGVGKAIESAAIPIRIPTTGVESLNAAVAAAVMLYEAYRQRRVS
jgi:TrmH family RNA methyltransferase